MPAKVRRTTPSNRPEVRCSEHFLRYTPLHCLPRKLCPPHQWTQPLGFTPSLRSFAQMSQFPIARLELYRRHGLLDQIDPETPPIVVLYSDGRQSKRCCRETLITAATCRSFAFSDWKAKSPVPIRPINVPITQKSRLFHPGRKSFPSKGLVHTVSGKEKEKDEFPPPPTHTQSHERCPGSEPSEIRMLDATSSFPTNTPGRPSARSTLDRDVAAE